MSSLCVGQFANSDGWEAALLQRFKRSRLIGLNLSMLLESGAHHPFDVLLERDSDYAVRPDLTFVAAQPNAVPVVGLCLVEEIDGATLPSQSAFFEA